MIESIHIKNFRGIQDGKIDRFSKINLLVGPNNSGKSAVLEAIYISGISSRSSTLELPNDSYDVQIAESDFLGKDAIIRVGERHGYSNSKTREEGKIPILDFGGHLPMPSFRLTAKVPRYGKELLIGAFRVNETTLIQDIEKSKDKTLSALTRWVYGKPLNLHNDESLIYCWVTELTYGRTGLAGILVKGKLPVASNTFFYDVQNALSHLPFEYFRRMLNKIPGWTHKIARSYKRIFQSNLNFNVTFLQLQHDPNQTQGFIAPEDKVALTIDDYGDGARSAFKLLTPLIALAELATEVEPGVFIWEEPELFQNPRTLGTLLEEIAALIKGKPVQLFIATHSLDVIAQFTALAESGQIEYGDLMTFRLNLQEGQLTSSWFNVDNLKAWMEEGLDPRVWGEFKSPLQFRFQEDGE
jgi:hypothetical protein